MRIETCYFCSQPVYPSKGSTFIRNDSKVFHFCRSKCQKNFNMKRNPRKLRWTKSFRRAAGKELPLTPALALSARRNIPTRYDRTLVATTLQAMERIAEIRARRERAFYKKRMAGNKARQRATDRKLVAENEHLLPRERGSVRKAREMLEGLEESARLAEGLKESRKDQLPGLAEARRMKVKRKLLRTGEVAEEEMDVD